VPNSFKENVCENVNTLAHVVEHLVVLAPSRRRWCLSGREGFRFLYSSCRACEAIFRRFRGVKTTIFLYAVVEI
jgi:hypothetical protein